jgi:hypothetical protein
VSKTVRRIALGEAFWPQGLRTRGASTDNISWMLPDVARRWKQRLGDFTEYRLPEMDRYGIDMQVLPDGRAEAAAHHGQARAGLRRRGTAAAGARLCRPVVPAVPRRGGDRRVPGDRDAPVRARGHPVRP